MLEVRRDARGFMEVKETLLCQDTVTFWYYDTEQWLKTSAGKEGDTPDRVCTQQDIAWAEQHYLPRLAEGAKIEKPFGTDYNFRAGSWGDQAARSMEAEGYYAAHSRLECAAEWRRRYDALKAAETETAMA